MSFGICYLITNVLKCLTNLSLETNVKVMLFGFHYRTNTMIFAGPRCSRAKIVLNVSNYAIYWNRCMVFSLKKYL